MLVYLPSEICLLLGNTHQNLLGVAYPPCHIFYVAIRPYYFWCELNAKPASTMSVPQAPRVKKDEEPHI